MKDQYGFVKKEDANFPPVVIVNVTNVCNLACVHCAHPVIKKRADYKPMFMSETVFEKVAKEVSQNKITVMRIASDGEALIHPRFFDFIKIAKSYKIYPVNLTTNASFMDEKACQKILDSGIDVVDVSIDALNEATYKVIRVGGDLKQVMKNTLTLIEMRNKIKSPLKIFVSFVRQKLNEHEVDAFVKFWQPKVDFVLMRNYCNEVGLVQNNGLEEEVPERWPCTQFWKRVTINFKGELRFCVEDWLNKTVVDNIMNRSIKDMWQGKEYERFRQNHLQGRYGEQPLCGPCTDWKAAPWGFGYDKIINTKVHGIPSEELSVGE